MKNNLFKPLSYTNFFFKKLLACVFAGVIWSGAAKAQSSMPFQTPVRGFTSWQPAANWEHALITGNGTMGALVIGQPHTETIIFSHSDLYLPLNAPKEPIDQASRLQEIRLLLLEGKNEQAAKIPVEQRSKEGFNIGRDPFIPAFNLEIEHPASNIIKYQRAVNFETGEARVEWQDGNGVYTRSVFVSRPDSLIVLSIKGTGKINCKLNFESLPVSWEQSSFVNKAVAERSGSVEPGWLTYKSKFKNHYPGGLEGYEGVGRLIQSGGSSAVTGKRLVVSNADEILLFIKILPSRDYSRSRIENIKAELLSQNLGYNELLQKHTVVHGTMFNRSKLILAGDAKSKKLHTEELLLAAKDSVSKALIEKVFDAGRYNILSATGSNPPNLQGMWSGTWSAPWSSDFTHDGNLPSAIASNLSSNMPELMDAFFSYHERFMPTYRFNAKKLYGTRGIHIPAHTSNNGLDTDFGDVWCLTYWTGAAGWASHFFYDYYQYTGDLEFLRERAFPFMKEAALFYEDFLTKDETGKLMFNPSYSPENNPANSPSQAAINATMDVMIAKQLLSNCISAAKILGESSKIAKWKTMLAAMPSYQVAADGTLREWLWKDMEENHKHRHTSQLYSLYDNADPEIVNNPALLLAVKRTIDEKMKFRIAEGGGEMAFGLVQLGLAAAHIGEAEKAGQIVDWLSSKYWSSGMGSFHNVGHLFNTDISGGLPAVIIEMLAYSQPGKISILPALPKKWLQGKIEGVLLRGQVELKELAWENKKLRLVIRSAKQQTLEFSFPSSIKSFEGVNIKRASPNSLQIVAPAGEDIAFNVLLH